jgi:hypothetical protein
MRQGKTGTESVGNFLASASGAAVGTMATMYDGVIALGGGDYDKAAEKIIPIKLAQNLIRAGRYGNEGLTNKNGEVILPDERFSVWDLTMRGAGFQPIQESEYYAANQAVEGRKQAVTDVRSGLLRKYAQAKIKGESVSEIDAKIAEFNQRHNVKGVRIDVSSKLKAVQSRKKAAAERDESGVKADKNTGRYLEQGRFATGQ